MSQPRLSIVLTLSCLLLATQAALLHAQPKLPVKRPGNGNEIEGAIWQYEASIEKKEQKLTGKIRLDARSIFVYTPRRVAAEKEQRIGDVIVAKGKPMQLVFDDPKGIKGRAIVEWDAKQGMWIGRFDDKEGVRWRFELRRSED